jgi:hypothetical protein
MTSLILFLLCGNLWFSALIYLELSRLRRILQFDEKLKALNELVAEVEKS